MAVSPAPEGSLAARFAALLRHHLRVGTRPAGSRGTGAWTLQALSRAGVSVTKRTLEDYCNGSTRPGDISAFEKAFFGDDPRHALKRQAFLIAFALATGTEPPPWAFATSNVTIHVPTHFMGRNEPLAMIHSALHRLESRVAITALHGLRGVGKTVLAAAYAEQHRGDYRATWWVRAQTADTMRADLVALGGRLGWVDADEKEEPGLAVVMERLRHEGEGILLIYDNAVNARSLTPFLPHGGAARLLITSNAHAWRGLADPVEVGVWPRAIGADYLITRTGRAVERAAAEQLSEALGGLPLAHEMAAAYCEQLDVSLPEYSRRFGAAPSRMLDDDRRAPPEYHDGLTVAKTFALAIEKAAQLHPAAEVLIQHLALLPPEPIPLFLFQEGRSEFDELLASLTTDENLDEAVAALRAFALVDRETIADEREPGIATDTLRLHRLVREIAAARLTSEAQAKTRCRLVIVMDKVYPADVVSNPRTWPRARRLNTAAIALVGSEKSIPKGVETEASDLLNHLSLFYLGPLAAHVQARSLSELSLSIREKAFGPDHQKTAMSLSNLASLLLFQGDTAEAHPLYERALAIFEKSLGTEHYTTVMCLNNVALTLRIKGDLARARLTFERVLPIFEKVFGSEDTHTVSCLNNLGLTLQLQSDLAGARPLFERALAVREKSLGPDHLETGVSLNRLACLLIAQGSIAQARPLFERALAIREKAFGPYDPGTAVQIDDVAKALHLQGNVTEARPLFERALAIQEKLLGPDHRQTAAALYNLAYHFHSQGNFAAARPLIERALTTYEKVLGADHVRTNEAAQLAMEVLTSLASSEEALALRRRYPLPGPEKRLGEGGS